jgi:vanillate O-demethylase monooxygenase subunit
MAYLRNVWYPAAWPEEVTPQPHVRFILDQPIVFYRGESGEALALSDTCPHRFAPLHMGKVQGDIIACPYHGLRFGPDGKCVHNPHGGISSTFNIPAYSLAEHYGLLWIWIGDAPADPEKLPVIPEFADRSFTWVHGTIDVAGNYQLLIDNLLDLSHVEFMHPMLGMPGAAARTRYEARVDGDRVYSMYWLDDEPTSPVIRLSWPDAPEHTRFDARMRWEAPANLALAMRVTTVGGDLENPVISRPTIHLMTPVSETQTRYFWAAGRNVATEDQAVSAALRAGTEAAFKNEDAPMIAAIQARTKALGENAPAQISFRTDASAIQARRILARLTEAQKPQMAEAS